MGDDTRRTEAAATLCAFLAAGYTPESVNEMARTNDLSKLRRSGPLSVQLQPPDDEDPPAASVGGS